MGSERTILQKPADKATLRRELLRLIVKREAERRGRHVLPR